jgi:hypothetical protein
MLDVLPQPYAPQQGVVLLVIDLAVKIITDRFTKRRHPYPPLRVCEHIQYLHIGETVFCGIVHEMSPVEPADTGLRTYPNKAIPVLRDTINGRTRKTIGNIEMGIAIFLGKGGTRQQTNKKAQE